MTKQRVTTVEVKGQQYTVETQSGGRAVRNSNGEVVGQVFKMSGDREFRVLHKDHRGHNFPMYYLTAEKAVAAMLEESTR